MDITNRRMAEPQTDYNWLEHVIQLIKDVAPFGAAVAICHQFISRVFKYKSEQRKAEIRELIQAEVSPEITELKHSITELTKSIGALERKIKP